MPGTKRKRIKQKPTSSSKRIKREGQKAGIVKMTSSAFGDELMEEDQNEPGPKCDADSKNGDSENDAKAKANLESISKHNHELAHENIEERREQRRSSSEEEEEEEEEESTFKVRNKQEEPPRQRSSAKTRASHETATSRWSDSSRATYGWPQRYDRGWEGDRVQKSPQLVRRPLLDASNQRIHFKPESATSRSVELCLPEARSSSKNVWLLIPAIVVLVLPCFAYIALAPPAPVPQSFERVLKQLEANRGSFLSKFSSMSPNNWHKIRSAVKATTRFVRPRSPGVIAIVSLAASETVASCVGRKLANELRAAYNDSEFVSLRGEDYKGRDADDVMQDVDRRVRNGLDYGTHVVLLEGLHHLPAKSGLIFNGLCDNDNAPFKQAIYVFTSVTDAIVAESNQQVTTFWKDDMPADQRHSLETRIGNNIVVVNSEKNDSFYKECA